MDFPSRGLRRTALLRIASLSTTSSSNKSPEPSDLERLARECPQHPNGPIGEINGVTSSASEIPMPARELEVLLSLCRASPLLQSIESAEKLLHQIVPYMSESYCQQIMSSPLLSGIEPSPWECLTSSLTSAVLSLGLNFPKLRGHAKEAVHAYLDNILRFSESEARDLEILTMASVVTSFIGFLGSLAMHANFWTWEEQLELISSIKRILSEAFMISVESTFSTIRNSHSRQLKPWKRYTRHYAAIGRPLGSMLLQRGFMRLLLSCTSLFIADQSMLHEEDILDILMRSGTVTERDSYHDGDAGFVTVKVMAEAAAQVIALFEDGADYLQLGTVWQQRLAFSVKAFALASYCTCLVLAQKSGNLEILVKWLEATMEDPVQMADEILATVTLKVMAVLSEIDTNLAARLSRTLPRFIVRSSPSQVTVRVAAKCLAHILQFLSQDAVITTLYTLGNVLSSGSSERALATGPMRERLLPYHQETVGSAISLSLNSDEEKLHVYSSVIEAVVVVARTCNDHKIIALAQSILIQKIGKLSSAVDMKIVMEVASLALVSNPTEFKSILKLYSKLGSDAVLQDNQNMMSAVHAGRTTISSNLSKDSPLFEIFLADLLEGIVSKEELHDNELEKQFDQELTARLISQLLLPLARLLTHCDYHFDDSHNSELLSLCRDAWYNCVVHGFSHGSKLAKTYDWELKIIAKNSPPLIADTRASQLESDMELNTVLRRGMTPRNIAEHKRKLISLLPTHENEIRGLIYPKVIFLETAFLLESLRASSGDCSKVLSYFSDPNLKTGETANCMVTIASEVTNIYLHHVKSGNYPNFSAGMVAKQLVEIFTKCCHRVEKVHSVALLCAEKIVVTIPSALCHKSSVYAMLELLTLMWSSCLDEELDEYTWRSTLTSERGNVTIELSDSYALRRNTLKAFHAEAKNWMAKVLNVAPTDVKGLLQTYLSEHNGTSDFNDLALGRTFALEMCLQVPINDQRLVAAEQLGECKAKGASDFILQYTTRQSYRHAEPVPEHKKGWLSFMHIDKNVLGSGTDGRAEVAEIELMLSSVHSRALEGKYISIAELRDVLKRASSVLCRSSEREHNAIIHHLVSIPFALFTTQAIELGISLWVGVMHENMRLQSRILVEIAHHWEVTMRKKVGLFSDRVSAPDAFSMKMEYSPSDKNLHNLEKRETLNSIIPHQKVLLLLSSHFHACRLGNPHILRIFQRIIRISMIGLKNASSHPLSRETRLQLVVFALHVIRFSCNTMDLSLQQKLKDQILSGALSWFYFAPMYSFGGNRLQIRSELQAITSVIGLLQQMTPAVAEVESTYSRILRSKQDLLIILLENEHARLTTWLFPVENIRKPYQTYPFKPSTDNSVPLFLPTAWQESPSLAIQLTRRFQSPRLHASVRKLLLAYPDKVASIPEALQIMLDDGIPADVNVQLKYLLYWAPLDPISAAAYFLPSYSNNAFTLQYAMRTLESHSVDATFFYVPQIVQALRWDSLGYVERLILETAKFSQLFAHQIIWNMKANAYKDEDSLIPDEVKPKLDAAMERLIGSFSRVDREFYEREFEFFGEVTSISGKLRPYIKKTKAEKKQKIDEELRKIKVDVGVYVPSNPDGVVIGIDRKSGKPLQSHAKAPFMATFRIKRTPKKSALENEDFLMQNGEQQQRQSISDPGNEMWLSAIFKVGDDVRQDMLVLQIISVFRSIFNSVGLDVYVYPYRVLATAPGCGVIDLIPKSISRDMLGREAVNGLYDYFTSKHGGEDSIKFQEARNNFVKSMAAYSIISYLLQLKDRHNGNIMIDDAGHIIHIDFGFCFDIAPGGITFERAPFKLTAEMVAVMGRSIDSQPFHWYEELCIKAFLACRPYADKLAYCVKVMSASGLPCFKPETIQNFKDRFVLDKNEKEATEYVRGLIKKSYSSYSTKGYDQFQLLTNGIPY